MSRHFTEPSDAPSQAAVADYQGNICLYYILSSENSDSWIVISCLHLFIVTPFELALVAVTERSCQQIEHNGAMTVKCLEMLKQLCRKQGDENRSDLPEGVVLPVNSTDSMQAVEAVLQDPSQVKQMASCQMEHCNLTEYVPAMLVPSVQEEPAMLV